MSRQEHALPPDGQGLPQAVRVPSNGDSSCCALGGGPGMVCAYMAGSHGILGWKMT